MVSIIYVIAGYDANPCIAYVLHALKKRREDHVPDEKVLSTLVENAFINMDTDRLDALVNDEQPMDARALMEA